MQLILNEFKWKTEEEMDAELKTIEQTRDYNLYGYDGHLLAATGEFEYKGMKYIINVMRYYLLANPKLTRVSMFAPMGSRKSEYFANLEYPESMNEIAQLVKMVRDYSSFLYNDTLHDYADQMGIDEQIQDMHQVAKADIDSLPELIKDIDNKILELSEVRRKISSLKIYEGK